MIVLPTSVRWVELCQILEDNLPRLSLLVGVHYVRQRLSMAVVVGQIGKVFASSPVHGIGESRMIGVQLTSVGEDLIGESVQLSDAPRKPWYGSCWCVYNTILFY